MIETVGEEAPSRLPEELEWTPPGPQLDALLASVNRHELGTRDLLRLAQARARQIAHQEAQLLADLHMVARTVPDQGDQPGRRDVPGRYAWAETEAAMALRWSNGRAGHRMELADEVIDRLPAIHAALDAGEIDFAKVLVFADLLMPLADDGQARAIVDRVIDQAPRWTTGQLRARLRRLVLAVDPQIGKQRAKAGSVGRRVVAFSNDNHLGVLSGHDLAPHRVAAVMERLDAIARAAKADGDTRRVDQLRADAFLDLLAGEGLATGGAVSDGSLEYLINDPPPAEADSDIPWPATPDAPDLLAPDPPPAVPQQEPVDVWAGGIPEPPAPPAEMVDTAELAWRAQQDRWLARFPLLSTRNPLCLRCRDSAQPVEEPPVLPGPRAGVVELQAPLTTLIGLAQLPGDLGGWGPVVADIARQVAEQMRNATWRFSIYDRAGELGYHGITTKRPEQKPRRSPRKQKRRPAGRFPDAKVAAYVKARDRQCVAPGCRRTGRGCDLDHTLDWIKDGESEICNLGLLCRRHHLLKHATGSELIQTQSGVFVWSLPSGMQYVTTPDRPLIDPTDLAELSRTPAPATPSGDELLGNQIPDPRYTPADTDLETDPHHDGG